MDTAAFYAGSACPILRFGLSGRKSRSFALISRTLSAAKVGLLLSRPDRFLVLPNPFPVPDQHEQAVYACAEEYTVFMTFKRSEAFGQTQQSPYKQQTVYFPVNIGYRSCQQGDSKCRHWTGCQEKNRFRIRMPESISCQWIKKCQQHPKDGRISLPSLFGQSEMVLLYKNVHNK